MLRAHLPQLVWICLLYTSGKTGGRTEIVTDITAGKTGGQAEIVTDITAGETGGQTERIRECVIGCCGFSALEERPDKMCIRDSGSTGIPDDSAGQFYVASGRRALCYDFVLSVPVGSELSQSARV